MRINENMSENDLYRVFQFTCMPLIMGVPLSLAVFEKGNNHLAISAGINGEDFPFDYVKEIVELEDKRILNVKEDHHLEDVSFLIRVRHKTKLLAVVALGKSEVELTDHQFKFIKTVANIVMVAIENNTSNIN